MSSNGSDLGHNNRRNEKGNSDNVHASMRGNGSMSSTRRKSINFQNQLQLALESNECDVMYCSLSSGRFRAPNGENFPPHGGKLKLSPLEKYDDSNRGVPPPSPAPNSDCFATCVANQLPSQSCSVGSVKPDSSTVLQKHGMGGNGMGGNGMGSNGMGGNGSYHQRHVSPNSRYRLERYRESQTTPQTKMMENMGGIPSAVPSVSSTRLLLPSNVPLPLSQCENYNAYLGSTVHTPVKRYVPTPPPAMDLYSDLTISSSPAANLPTPATASTSTSAVQSQYANMPYNFRSKCCHNETSHGSLSRTSQTYASCSPACTSPSPAPSTSMSMVFSAASSCSPIMTATSSSRSGTHRGDDSDSVIVVAPGGGSIAQLEVDNPSGTCLHCNTVRRTTGVHQTTQTTGPISPVPISLPVPMSMPVISGLSEQIPSQNLESSMVSVQAKRLEGSGNMAVPPGSNQHQMYRSQIASNPRLQHIHHQTQQHQSLQVLPQPQMHHLSCKKRIGIYMRRTTSQFFGVEPSTEVADCALWQGRHRRLAIRCFGMFDTELEYHMQQAIGGGNEDVVQGNGSNSNYAPDRPDILPVQDAIGMDMNLSGDNRRQKCYTNRDFLAGEFVERKASVGYMFVAMVSYLVHMFNKRRPIQMHRVRCPWQWSRSFAPLHVTSHNNQQADADCLTDGLEAIIDDEVFFDSPCEITTTSVNDESSEIGRQTAKPRPCADPSGVGVSVYMAERQQNGWRTSALNSGGNASSDINLTGDQSSHPAPAAHIPLCSSVSSQMQPAMRSSHSTTSNCNRGNRITAQLLDGVLENSRRPPLRCIKYFSVNDLDDRTDHRPFFTYWINTVQVVVLILSIICYGIAPIGIGSEQKTGQVLVTSLSLQTVQHVEQRNLWIGPRNIDLVHMGAKFAACMRRDIKITEVVTKTRRHERETACCIRNDDSGCVQSSQAECSIRGLYPTKSISTWKKWSPSESGPGGRISGSVCGLDPKFCDAPASIAPYEWPDDITKWPICRKTNSFTQRYRYKDHTSEHMVCEVIGHPCCTGLYGECRITTREYCDFIKGYFHEEASLCSQISCLNNVCGMFPFISVETPDQLYRLLTSLCMHAGILHLAITLIFQHLFLADLERLIGTVRTAIVYIMSGFAGNLTSAILVPHRPEVGPSASLSGVVASLIALLVWMHWKYLHKPHIALFKLLLLCSVLVGIGTLPYQLNFLGLLAGVICGCLLTMSLVPFTTFSKYGRKKKINLIWTCVLFHVIIYTAMIVTFYIHPSEFHSISFVDMFSNNNGYGYENFTNTDHHGVDVVSSNTRYSQTQNSQYYYHHHSDDIIRKSVTFTEKALVSHILYPAAPRKTSAQQWQEVEFSRSFNHLSNYSDRIKKSIGNISKLKQVFTSPIRFSNKNNHSNLMTELTSVHSENKQKYLSYINNTEFNVL
ncbi:inactive rhomboid protein 1 [Drosophila rhopaloa]|uniref:Peptidase S54 rhomboid domain-containing protein n=1 Tax=Drosophila rhopaloa TaxID=1041015 RepID=A0ABM5H553_DRORH|nr:inactive rhomboid protein 1 [Drosophila rhopaloa]